MAIAAIGILFLLALEVLYSVM